MAVRVRESFSFDFKGVPTTLREGELYEDAHPFMKGREQMFEPADDAARTAATPATVYTSETATAAPGEARALSAPARKRGTNKEG